MKKDVTVAIVGGGFSGVCTLLHLVKRGNAPFHIVMIEKQKKLGQGTAYGTKSPHHPLNVPAGKMSAFFGQSRHFYSWLKKESARWRKLDATFKTIELTPESFLPRKLYAVYLQDLLAQALQEAKKKGIACTILHREAIDATIDEKKGQITILLDKGKPIVVDSLVLALGTPAIRKLSFETSTLLKNRSYISNLWSADTNIALKKLYGNDQGKGKKIVLLGSGLTAVDLLFSLQATGYQGAIYTLSNSGTLPQIHTQKPLPPYPSFKKDFLPKEIPALLHLFRGHLQEPALNWRQLIDAFRSCTQGLWQSLPLHAKKQFLRHLFSVWNKHRHRMSPKSLEVEQNFEKNGSLTLISGVVKNVIPLSDKILKVVYCSNDTTQTLEVDMVMNCSGPDYQINHHPGLLLQNLLKREIVLPDELGLGLKLNRKGHLEGKGKGKVFAIGALLFGELFETTAVPELREQANVIAKELIKQSKVLGS